MDLYKQEIEFLLKSLFLQSIISKDARLSYCVYIQVVVAFSFSNAFCIRFIATHKDKNFSFGGILLKISAYTLINNNIGAFLLHYMISDQKDYRYISCLYVMLYSNVYLLVMLILYRFFKSIKYIQMIVFGIISCIFIHECTKGLSLEYKEKQDAYVIVLLFILTILNVKKVFDLLMKSKNIQQITIKNKS